jgi:undecaprenyl-diphosphatase
MFHINLTGAKWTIINLSLLLIIAFIIKFFDYNLILFYKINQYHYLLSDNIWKFINLLAYSKYSILLLLLLILTYSYKKQEMLRILLLCFSYFLCFYVLKKIFHEPRPYVILSSNSFHFIPHFEDYIKSSFMSFPSGHTGQVSIFVLGVFYLFKPNLLIRLFLVLLILLVGISRICSGWHWPLDIIASMIIASIISIVIFSLDLADKQNV